MMELPLLLLLLLPTTGVGAVAVSGPSKVVPPAVLLPTTGVGAMAV